MGLAALGLTRARAQRGLWLRDAPLVFLIWSGPDGDLEKCDCGH